MDEVLQKKELYNYDDNEELIRISKTGDKNALDTVIRINLPLVSSISKKISK